MLHSKTLVVDADLADLAVAVIGSSNMDIRSSQLGCEVSLLGLGAAFIKDLTGYVTGYRNRSFELAAKE